MKSALFAGLALALSTSLAASADQKELAVWNWADFIDETVVPDFTEATGVSVEYNTYASAETVETLLAAGGTGMDLVIVASESVHRLVSSGALQPINLDAAPNAAEIEPSHLTQMESITGPGGYALPYVWGMTGIAYNPRKVLDIIPDAPLDSWAMLFDPAIVSQLADCGVSFLEGPEEMIGAAMMYNGHDPHSDDPAILAEAMETIRAVRPYIKSFDSEHAEDLAYGEVCVAAAWSGDALTALDYEVEDLDVVFTIPREGGFIWYDVMVIPADAKNVEGAHALINHLQNPETMAKTTNWLWYANATPAADPLINADARNHETVYPSHDTKARLHTLQGRDARTKRRLAREWLLLQAAS